MLREVYLEAARRASHQTASPAMHLVRVKVLRAVDQEVPMAAHQAKEFDQALDQVEPLAMDSEQKLQMVRPLVSRMRSQQVTLLLV